MLAQRCQVRPAHDSLGEDRGETVRVCDSALFEKHRAKVFHMSCYPSSQHLQLGSEPGPLCVQLRCSAENHGSLKAILSQPQKKEKRRP